MNDDDRAKLEALPAFDDPHVQIVYRILCDTDLVPPPDEHWEGFTARHVVAALASAQAASAEPVAPLMILSTGRYSDYSWQGPFRVLRRFTMREAKDAFLAQWKPDDSVYSTGPSDSEFQSWLLDAGYLEDMASNEVHVGGYGELEISAEALDEIHEPAPPAPAVAPAAVTDPQVSEALGDARKAIKCLFLEAPAEVVAAAAAKVEWAFSMLQATRTPEPAEVTDEQIEAAVRPLYANDAAAKMGIADDIRTARAVLALATRTPEPQAEQPKHLDPVEDRGLIDAANAALGLYAEPQTERTVEVHMDREHGGLAFGPHPDSRGQAREGWKLVRVEPIEAMEQFICTCDSRSGAGYTRDGEPVSPSWRTCYASLLAVASTPDEQRAQAAQEDVEAIVDRVCNDVAELPDRNSPEDWPEAMLVTHDELAEIVRAALAGRQQ